MDARRGLAVALVALLVIGGITGAVSAEGNETDGGREVVTSWNECRDGREYQITEYEDGSREEEEIGSCEAPESDPWIVSSWCDGNERVEEWEDADGERWQERHPDSTCEGRPDTDEQGWIVETWCDGSDRVDEWENATGARWQERYHDPACDQPQHHEDPYGCDSAAGEWWDHYHARCIGEEVMQIQNDFWQCIDDAHRGVAEEQKRLDVEAREARDQRRALEREAMEHERAGRWDEAQRIWETLNRMEWEDQKRFHQMDQRLGDAIGACIDQSSQRARAPGADFLIDEFEMHRFHAAPPMPTLGPGPAAYECQPGASGSTGGFDHSDRDHGGGTYDTGRDETSRPADHPGHPGPGPGAEYGERPGPGPDGPGCIGEQHADAMMEMEFGLPPEAQAAIKEAMAWCEEQMWAIDSERFEAATYEEAQALEDRMRAVERECSERMEAIFRQYDQGHASEMDRLFGGFQMSETRTGIEVLGTNLVFNGKPEQSRITDFNCRGVPVLSAVSPYFEIQDAFPTAAHKLSFFDRSVMDHMDHRTAPSPELMAGKERDAFMVVHDDPHCTIGIRPERAVSEEAEVKLVFPSLYACEEVDDHIVCGDEETEILVRVHGERPVLLDSRTLIVSEHVVIRLAGGVGDSETFEQYNKDEHFDGSAAVAKKDGKLVAQTVSVGDLQMAVAESDDGKGVKVSLDKATHVGSFVVVTLDVFESCSIEIVGWDVTDGAREPLELRKARNLVDALDAEYDGDHAKYYAVKDDLGCQLIITNSHYSTKEFVVHAAASGDFLQNLPVVGVAVIGAGLLATVALLRRREDDEA